jgi:ubiquinone/menaquinone biosynthesis C-methylase UbiE
MKNKNKKIDWSTKQYKRALIDTRKHIWRNDTIDKIAKWIGLRHGMRVLDVGCGLGYLGYTFWPYFKKTGRYVGVDINTKLILDAKRNSKIWAKRQPFFITGDVYKLPLASNSIDCVMCQTLLIHLKVPLNVLYEFFRVVKPGGVVICIEPDNLSWRCNDSRSELSVTDRCLLYEYDLIWNRGHIKQGVGDYTIGAKMLHIMKKVGFKDLDVRLNDMVYFLEPPYDSPVQQSQFKMLRNQVVGKKKGRKSWIEEEKKLYLAGGGKIRKFNRIMRIYNNQLAVMKRQVKNREYFRCLAGSFYIAKGTKPE